MFSSLAFENLDFLHLAQSSLSSDEPFISIRSRLVISTLCTFHLTRTSRSTFRESSARLGGLSGAAHSENATCDITRIISAAIFFFFSPFLHRSSRDSRCTRCASLIVSHDPPRRAEYILASITRIWRDVFVRATSDSRPPTLHAVSAHVRSSAKHIPDTVSRLSGTSASIVVTPPPLIPPAPSRNPVFTIIRE